MPVALRPCRSSANADAASATSARALRSSRWGELLCFRASCASVSLMATQGHGSDFERPSLQTVMKRSWESSSDRDWAEVLHALPLFSTMGKRQVQKLARVASVRDYEPDENLVRVGEPGDSFYVLLEGRARPASWRLLRRNGPSGWWSAFGNDHGNDARACDQTATSIVHQGDRTRSTHRPLHHGRARRACPANRARAVRLTRNGTNLVGMEER
jgi:hypothetical protein